MPLAICPSRVFHPNSVIVKIKPGSQTKFFQKSANDFDPRLVIVFTASNVVSIQPTVNCLFAATKIGREFVTAEIWKLRLGFQNLFFGNWRAVQTNVRSLNFWHCRVGKAENVGNVYHHESAWNQNLGVTLNHFSQHFLPILKCYILFIFFPDEIRRRPKTQGDACGFNFPHNCAVVSEINIIRGEIMVRTVTVSFGRNRTDNIRRRIFAQYIRLRLGVAARNTNLLSSFFV